MSSNIYIPFRDRDIPTIVPKIRRAAKGQDCTLRLYPHCSNNPDTTVLAHLPSNFKGWSIKSPDWIGVFACHQCHRIIDGEDRYDDITPEIIYQQYIRALFLTWQQHFSQGILKLGD